MKTFAHFGVALLAGLLLGGCVERKITIGSDPPGALVYLNDVEVGRTPISVPYKWQGDYDLRFRLEQNVGTTDDPKMRRYYLHTSRKTKTPWFDIVPIDLFAELAPMTFRHEEVWAFPLPEVVEPPDAELVERAKILKEQTVSPK